MLFLYTFPTHDFNITKIVCRSHKKCCAKISCELFFWFGLVWCWSENDEQGATLTCCVALGKQKRIQFCKYRMKCTRCTESEIFSPSVYIQREFGVWRELPALLPFRAAFVCGNCIWLKVKSKAFFMRFFVALVFALSFSCFSSSQPVNRSEHQVEDWLWVGGFFCCCIAFSDFQVQVKLLLRIARFQGSAETILNQKFFIVFFFFEEAMKFTHVQLNGMDARV